MTTINGKTEILLLGITHFHNPGKDFSNIEMDDILSAQRQNEIEQVTEKLSVFSPGKIFIEAASKSQPEMDKEFKKYLSGKLRKKRNEIYQVAFRLAAKLGHERLYCVNEQSRLKIKPLMRFARKNDMQRDIKLLKKDTVIEAKAMQSILKQSTMPDFLKHINTETAVLNNHNYYNDRLMRIAAKHEYPGIDVVAEWYKVNMKVYVNILKAVTGNDKRALVIYGQGHIRILKHLFEDNPSFVVQEADEWL